MEAREEGRLRRDRDVSNKDVEKAISLVLVHAQWGLTRIKVAGLAIGSSNYRAYVKKFSQ